jgi:hypothetical protein
MKQIIQQMILNSWQVFTVYFEIEFDDNQK